MDVFSVPSSSSDPRGSSDYSISESITLFGHRIETAVPVVKLSRNSDDASMIPQKRKLVQTMNGDNVLDADNAKDSKEDKECDPIINLSSTSKKTYWLVQSWCCFNRYIFTLNDVHDILPPSFFIKIKSLEFDHFPQIS
ncbi:hypothetical protein ZOSMA_152G00010 [Zostera marina]|uniref:Uncharacterized protein n=1 Tax=Zostera marina TaxID=29655 RepID=A0A0K9PVV3_ZOSMR|nr:hypothetical protein ZOSMA_152G00010 [Zostera marina]